MINHVQVIYALDSLLDELKSHQKYGIDAQCGASLNMLTNAYVLSSGFAGAAGAADAELSLEVLSPVATDSRGQLENKLI
jgi:hypothetical protein